MRQPEFDVTHSVLKARDDQVEAIDAAVNALTLKPGETMPARGLRTQLIRCTGSGKSLIATQTAMKLGAGRIRVMEFVPTLGLLSQTATSWRAAGWRGPLFGVSSLHGDVAGFPNTTDVDELVDWANGLDNVAILATYASLAPQTAAKVIDNKIVAERYGLIERAFRGETASGRALEPMDLVIVDEAHRTSGAAAKPWAAVHDNTRIRADRCLSTTATPRMWEPDGGETGGRTEVASMDDDPDGVFGGVCHSLPLAEGIRRGIVAPYEVVCVEIRDPQAHSAELLSLDDRSDEVRGARLAALQTALMKAVTDEAAETTLIFHQRTREAEAFATGMGDVAAALHEADPEHYPHPSLVRADWLCGEHSPAHRDRVLDTFATGLVGDTEMAHRFLGSVKLLGEGVDTRECKSVFWADVRGSMPDLVQAAGRALRMQPGEGKVAKLIVPILLGPNDSPEQMLTSKAYSGLARLLAALAAHDARIVEALAPQQARSRSTTTTSPEGAGPTTSTTGEAQAPQASVPALNLLRFSTPRDPATLAQFIKLRSIKPEPVYWRAGIEAATAYLHHRGDLRVPYDFRTPKRWKDSPPNFPLGVWIADARRNHSQENLSEERIADLDALGMIWNHPEVAFNDGLTASREWAAEHNVGLAAPGDATWKGYPVGAWLKKQRIAGRRAQDNARRRAEGLSVETTAGALSDERYEMLEEIDTGWCPAWPVSWQRAYRLTLDHLETTGALPGPEDGIVAMGEDLGQWIQTQQQTWDRLSTPQQWFLESCLHLEPAPAAPKPQRRSWSEKWLLNLTAARQFREREGHLTVPRSHSEMVTVDGEEHRLQLGTFLANSRKRAMSLAPERREELTALGMRWS